MKVLFTGGLGDFIGAESFMTEEEKDSVKTVLWATRNRLEIKAACELTDIFPNMEEERVLFDDFCDVRPTRPWQPGDRFMNIGRKHELNQKCNLNLSQEELDTISDHSLDGTLDCMFAGTRRFQTSRFVTRRVHPDVSRFYLPEKYVVIHPWSDSEINNREFNSFDWTHVFDYLNANNLVGVVVNKSIKHPPQHKRLIDLTNKTTLKETFAIISKAYSSILCASSLACYASKIFPKGRIFLKAGYLHMLSPWATYFYHGPFTNPADIINDHLGLLVDYTPKSNLNTDRGFVTLL